MCKIRNRSVQPFYRDDDIHTDRDYKIYIYSYTFGLNKTLKYWFQGNKIKKNRKKKKILEFLTFILTEGKPAIRRETQMLK